jgi:transcription initiation factor TFIID TATA-box-binding protein
MKNEPYTMSITNVVATVKLDGTIDLNKIKDMPGMSEREKFPGLVYRPEDAPATVLIYSTGKLSCTGAKSYKDAGEAINKCFKHVIKKFYVRQLIEPVKVGNIAASGDFHGYIDIDRIDELHDKYPERYQTRNYESGQFSGVPVRDKEKYKPNGEETVLEENPVIRLFLQGKFTCTGFRREESLESRIRDLYEALIDLKLLEKNEEISSTS